MAREYAFLMIDYYTPEIIKDIHNKISDEEVYTEKDKEYGIEYEMSENNNLEFIRKQKIKTLN